MQQKILKRDNQLQTALTEIKVADLNFCFDNRAIIELLKERGEAIAKQNFDEVNRTETKINALIRSDYDTLVTPMMCVITFEEDEGLCIAHQNNSTRKRMLLGQRMVFGRSKSPSDMIWENHNNKNFYRNLFMAFLAILIVLAISFVFFYGIQKR